MGAKALRKIQLGQEAVAGTPVPAEVMWYGTGALKDNRTLVFPTADVGILSSGDTTYTSKYEGVITTEAEASFEQLPYPLSAGVQAVAGVADGAGSGYVWTYNLATTAANTVSTYTIEAGDDAGAEEMEYSFVQSIKLSGTAGEPLTCSADWLGRQVTVSAFTGGIAVPTIYPILFNKGSLYIDALSGSFGGTKKTSTFVGMDLTLTTGFQPVYTADGSLYFTFVKQVAPELLVNITFEHELLVLRNLMPDTSSHERIDPFEVARAGDCSRRRAFY